MVGGHAGRYVKDEYPPNPLGETQKQTKAKPKQSCYPYSSTYIEERKINNKFKDY